jgi:predicted metal-dependent hydrolase
MSFSKAIEALLSPGIRSRLNAHSATHRPIQEVMDIPSVRHDPSAKYQWGGCSSRDRITFGWRIVLAPLRWWTTSLFMVGPSQRRNHSSNFWKIVVAIFPDYRVRRQWLREHGYLLDV